MEPKPAPVNKYPVPEPPQKRTAPKPWWAKRGWGGNRWDDVPVVCLACYCSYCYLLLESCYTDIIPMLPSQLLCDFRGKPTSAHWYEDFPVTFNIILLCCSKNPFWGFFQITILWMISIMGFCARKNKQNLCFEFYFIFLNIF